MSLQQTAVATRPASSITPIHEMHIAPFQESAPLVTPVAGIDQILAAWNSFTELKLRLLNDADFVLVRGERYAKKSAFRKLAMAFGISVEIVREDHMDFKDGTVAYLMTARASSPNGRAMTSCASCHSDEKKFSKPSDVRAVAQTRATNRAIADLIGWSTPSAEEVVGGGTEEPQHEHRSGRHEGRKTDNAPMERQAEDEGMATARQKTLLISLIGQKIVEAEDRETMLQEIESFTKEEASRAIQELLQPQMA